MTLRNYPEGLTKLPAGNWRLDPFKRIQVWVPDGPAGPDAFDEVEDEPVKPPEDAPHRTARCIDCGGHATRKSDRCQPCHFANRQANAARKRPPVTNPLGLHRPIDDNKVQAVINGTFIKCTRPERFEVIRRWQQLGRTDRSLEELTGWNVARDRRTINALNEKDTRNVA